MSLSAAGLLALADLSTIAQRTAIAGGSSWLDSLLLAPGLHYQQAADELARGTGEQGVTAVETDPDGRVVTHTINNAATAAYIRRVAKPGELITLDVGMLPQTVKRGFRRQTLGQHATVWTQEETPDLGWLSHMLYLISPVLTVFALVLMVLLQDCKCLFLLVNFTRSIFLLLGATCEGSEINRSTRAAQVNSQLLACWKLLSFYLLSRWISRKRSFRLTATRVGTRIAGSLDAVSNPQHMGDQAAG